MVKKELKDNFKSFIIWLSVLIIMFLIVFLIYPYIITDDKINNIDELMKVFPEEILKTFNMDMTSITTAYGWLKSEGFTFILLIIGIYSSMIGGNILLKEEDNKTIEYLTSLPVTRSKIISNKITVSIIYIISIILILGVFNYTALTISGDFNHKQYILLSITPIFIAMPFFSINLFISTFQHKSKKTIGISLGIVFISYLFNVLAELSKNVEFLKYISIYTLADIRSVITNTKINPLMIIISISITIIFIISTYIKYNRKEMV